MYRDGGDDTDGEDIVESEKAKLGLMPYQLEPVADMETQHCNSKAVIGLPST